MEWAIRSILFMEKIYIPIIPLPDGNGRTGRLLLFRECLRNGIVPVVVEDENRNVYMEALKAYREENSLDNMVRLFKKEPDIYLEKCRYFM